MNRTQKIILLTLALLSAAYFVIFYFPNSLASVDSKMVLVFQPDEAVPLPYVLDMIQPADSIKQALLNFAFYDYYFYGYPYFAVSALALLPVKWAGQLHNTTLVMTVLRQVVSVLPLLAAIWIIVYMQTRFRSYKAVLLFILLISLPAVVQNNFWWHPDGLAILFTTLALFFLHLDALRFGRFFFISAAMCGIAAMTKGIGFYFFLAVFVYLLIGYFGKKASLKKLILASLGYLLVMGVAYFASNPILIYSGVRQRFFDVMRTQSIFLTQGYDVVYPKGLLASLPTLKTYYGGWLILLTALATCTWGIWRGSDRLLQTLILAWLIPMSVLDFSIIHFKFQYWLPVALPLFSCLAFILPDKEDLRNLFHHGKTDPQKKAWQTAAPKLFLTAIVLTQLSIYTASNIPRYTSQLNRLENDESIQFYQQALKSLAALPNEKYYVYHDVRMYVPADSPWVTESIFEVLTYDFIEERKYDFLLLMQGRIYDYLNPAVQGIDPEKLAKGREFYQDADDGTIQGYRLIYRDSFGLVFVKDALYQEYFNSP